MKNTTDNIINTTKYQTPFVRAFVDTLNPGRYTCNKLCDAFMASPYYADHMTYQLWRRTVNKMFRDGSRFKRKLASTATGVVWIID